MLCANRLLDLRLHGFKIEARASLHRRKFDCSLGKLRDLLLHEHRAPEFKRKPVEVPERFAQTGTFERVKPQIG